MSHYITIPINEAGLITDSYFAEEILTVCAPKFGTTDVLLYSHGWWTDASSALATYNRFSTGFADRTLQLATSNPPPITRAPKQAFGIGLHWPSMISEDANSLIDKIEPLSFYTMEKRADNIGTNALYTILRKAIEINQGPLPPLWFHLLGHSFGCKVICSALQQIAIEKSREEIQNAVDFNVVLLQAAFKNNEFETGGDYDQVAGANLDARILLTTSSLDIALGRQFPLAQSINIFAPDHDRVALGFGGPTQITKQLFRNSVAMTLNPGFTHADLDLSSNPRLIVSDITPIHARNEQNRSYIGDSFGGHHSDIYSQELYELIAAFLFK